MSSRRPEAERILQTVLSAASVEAAVRSALQDRPSPPALILGGGKAGRTMAALVHEAYPSVPGSLAVPPQHAGLLGPLSLHAAGHPLPDENSIRVVDEQERLAAAHPGDVLFLLSGGATALLGAPLPGLTLAVLRRGFEALLHSGRSVQEMNLVRRHLTRWGGGKLAALLDRPVTVWTVSDVLDDAPEAIGSGPLAADPATFADAHAIARQVPGMPNEILIFLREGVDGCHPETRKPGDPVFAHVETKVTLSNRTVVAAVARALGGEVLPQQAGDVDAVAAMWSGVLGQGPGVYVAGGEPTVNIPPGADGRGGRNQHLVAELARRNPPGNWLFLSIATDGIDGNSENAGAWVDSTVASRAGNGAGAALEDFHSAGWCETNGLAFQTGPTGTNVADIQVGIVSPRS